MTVTFENVILLFYMSLLIIYIYYLYTKKAFNMNEKPLTRQHLFWASLIIPFTSFLVIGSICWKGHSLQIDSDGFNNFISISKLPLGLLSLSIPFFAIINNIHRTIQTDSQINEAKKKNSSDLFYSHQKYVIEYLSTKINRTVELPTYKYRFYTKREDTIFNRNIKIELSQPYKLYNSMFSNAHPKKDDLTVSKSFKRKLASPWLRLNSLLDLDKLHNRKNNKTTEHNYFNIVHCIYICLRRTAYLLELNDISTGTVFKWEKENKFSFQLFFADKNEIREYIQTFLDVIHDIFIISNERLFENSEIENILFYLKNENSKSNYNDEIMVWALTRSGIRPVTDKLHNPSFYTVLEES